MNYLLHHRSHRYFSLFFIFAFLLVLPLSTAVLVMNVIRGNTQSIAAGREQALLLNQGTRTEFASNEILAKVKKTVKAQIKTGNGLDTGVASLNKINGDIKTTKFEKFVQSSNNSKTDSDVFGWYKLTIDNGQEILSDTDTRPTLLWLKYLQAGNLSRDPKQLKKQKLKAAVAKLLSDPNIEAVEFNFVVRALQVTPTQLCPSSQNIPNDPYSCTSGSWGQTYPDLWGIKKINAQNAWKQSTGSAQVIVADVDTGADRNHEDLAANMWTNPGESGPTTQEGPAPNCTSRGLKLDKSCNNLDNDGDGYASDYYGWNFVNGTNDPMDDNGHGTHTAGTIGAVGNNGLGVVGVNWNVRIMALKFLDKSGSGTSDNAAKAIIYAADHGAKVINNSWGGSGTSSIIHDAVEYANSKNVVVVVAAGNSNRDAVRFTPANEASAITVAATDSTDSRASFSNYGYKIDVSAPGVDVLSLRAVGTDMYLGSAGYTPCGKCVPVGDPNAKYYRASGTSMASPHVAGLAALILANHPTFSPEEVRQVLRISADDIGVAGFDIYTGRGRINAEKALNVNSVLNAKISFPGSLYDLNSGTNVTISGSAFGSGFVKYDLSYGQGDNPTSWTPIGNTSNTPVINGSLGVWNISDFPTGNYILRLQATDSNSNVFDNYQTFYKENYVQPLTYGAIGDQIPGAFNGNRLVWTDDGQYYLNSTGQNIFMYDFSTKGLTQITPNNTVNYWPHISGDNIVYQRNNQQYVGQTANFNTLELYDIKSKVTKQIGQVGAHHPDISGDKVVYDLNTIGGGDIFLYDLVTGQERNLTNDSSLQIAPRISGNYVAWDDFRNNQLNVYVYDLTTNTTSRITTQTGDNLLDGIYGDKVVYENASQGYGTVYVYDLTKKVETPISSVDGAGWDADINDNEIVWIENRTGFPQVFMYDLATHKETLVSNYPINNKSKPKVAGNRVAWSDLRDFDKGYAILSDVYVYDPPIILPTPTPTPSPTPTSQPSPASLDTDHDGFPDAVETYIGTDPNSVCGVNAWPPDIDGDGVVSILDLAKMASAFGSKVGDSRYSRRYDMNANGKIDILDMTIAAQYFGQKCTSPVKTK